VDAEADGAAEADADAEADGAAEADADAEADGAAASGADPAPADGTGRVDAALSLASPEAA
jgi:hypothetical protein